MKKYKFRLGGVKRVREIVEEQSRAAMLEAQRDLEDATAQLDARLAEIGSARPSPGLRPAHEFLADREQMDRHLLAVTAARAAEANARLVLAAEHGKWVIAAQDVRVLERLDERRHESWILETTRLAQVATDEIANSRYRQEDVR